MIKRNKLICAFAAIGGTALLSAGIFSAPTPASAAEWNDIALQAEYSYGETLNVPARTLSAGGPDGKSVFRPLVSRRLFDAENGNDAGHDGRLYARLYSGDRRQDL